ncbi:sigma factor-like helix-turn-helix DNA-binding protein [Mediterraneibacter gnavus]|uniref:sigma factor-like helix-turn-helix DNA-binding protein n=1 Tax=Mediterraneibacter gnavus TaxID=33038 RepID=UPI0015F3098D|nr:sigma factor-like helix-turn-helix DNA-binding protein [Mediterraneibacter gnavus]
MDKRTLKKYKPNKDRLIRIENQIQELCERESTVVMGKVTGSSADFPYTEVRTSVQMYDPYENENVRQQIRRKEADRLRILKEQEEVEDYINGIDDPEIKEIFELAFVEGKKQQEVADIIGYSRGRISQIISEYLKD